MIFNSIKEINRLRKKINRLLSKRMSNIYLKNWRSQNFNNLSLKNLFSFWEAPTYGDMVEF